MMAAMIYASSPLPPSRLNTTQARRTSVGSMPKYSAIPAHTPEIIKNALDITYDARCQILDQQGLELLPGQGGALGGGLEDLVAHVHAGIQNDVSA